MTIKVRNRILLIIFFALLVYTLLNLSVFAYSVVNQTITLPKRAFRSFVLLDKIPLLQYKPFIVCAVAFFLNFYAIASTMFVYLHFEKTQAQEVIYFCGFLLSCSLESMRILAPVQNLWTISPASLLTLTRIICLARTLAPLSFLFASLFNDIEEKQFVERNFLIMLIIAFLVGQFLPINTFNRTGFFIYQWGLKSTFISARIFVILATIAAMTCKICQSPSKGLIPELAGYIILIAGYALLMVSDNMVFFISGAVLLLSGTICYLTSLHKVYLWK